MRRPGGLYLLSVTKGISMAPGDILVLAGAVVWAGHVLAIGWLSPGNDPIELALTQFAFCAVLSLLPASSSPSSGHNSLLSAREKGKLAPFVNRPDGKETTHAP